MYRLGWILLLTIIFHCCKDSHTDCFSPEYDESFTITYLSDTIIINRHSKDDCHTDTLIRKVDGYYASIPYSYIPDGETIILSQRDTTIFAKSTGGVNRTYIKKMKDSDIYESANYLMGKEEMLMVIYRYDKDYHITEIETSTTATFRPK